MKYKTIKITEEAHKCLNKIQSIVYDHTGKKHTYSEIIILTYLDRELKQK